VAKSNDEPMLGQATGGKEGSKSLVHCSYQDGEV
jgi:hypothetical protein